MDAQTEISTDAAFKKDVIAGLTAYPKYLYSKYIYDKLGDQLFQDIMAMESYYLTNAELEIFETRQAEILQHFSRTGNSYDLIELGAGDGKKTKILLQHLVATNCDLQAYRHQYQCDR